MEQPSLLRGCLSTVFDTPPTKTDRFDHQTFGLVRDSHFFSRRSILDQVSLRPIVRLNTNFPGVEAWSTQK